MTIERIPITSRDQWLALRRKDVTASVVGALFNIHQYETAYGLYQEKCGLELQDFDTSVLRRGRLLEPIFVDLVKEQRPQWKLEKATEYFRDPEARIGATPDFFVHGDARGPGIVQTKTAYPWVFKEKWVNDLPPFWIALQAATEMMLTGVSWGAVAVAVGFDLDLHIFDIPKHAGAEAKIKAAVAKFWADVEAGREPSPDYARDADLIAAMYPEAQPLKTVDLSGNNILPVILPERIAMKDQIKKAETRVKEIDAEVAMAMGDAEVATLPDFILTRKTTQRKAYSVAATSYRALRITDNRPKGIDDDDGAF